MSKNTGKQGKPPEPPLPTNEQAELFVLGSILRNDQLFAQVASLRRSDFTTTLRQRIFERMCDLHQRGESINASTVFLELQNHAEAECDTLSYLVELDHGLPELPSIKRYVDDVLEASLRRRMVHAGEAQMLSAADPQQKLSALLLVQRKYLDSIEERCGSTDDFDEFDGVPSPWSYEDKITYLVPDLVLQKGVTMLIALTGDGKSTLTLAMAAAVARGEPFLGRATIQCPVMYIDRENSVAVVKDRLARLGIGEDISAVLKFRGGWWEGHEPPGPDNPALIAYARRKQPLIIFDSLIAFGDCDENSATEMRRHLKLYRRLANLGASVLIQHHRSEKGEAYYRGSSDIPGLVDSTWLLSRDDGTTAADPLGRLLLKPHKARAAPQKPIRIQYSDGRFLPVDGPPRPAIDIICELVIAYPGSMQKDLIEAGKRYSVPKHLVLATLDEAAVKGLIVARTKKSGRQTSIRYYPAGSSLERVQ